MFMARILRQLDGRGWASLCVAEWHTVTLLTCALSRCLARLSAQIRLAQAQSMFLDALISSRSDLGSRLPARVSGFVMIVLSTLVALARVEALNAVQFFNRCRSHAGHFSGPLYSRDRPLSAERQQRGPT